MNRKYTLIIELENGEEVIHATTNTADDILNYLRTGEELADKREDQIMVEEYNMFSIPLYERIDDAD